MKNAIFRMVSAPSTQVYHKKYLRNHRNFGYNRVKGVDKMLVNGILLHVKRDEVEKPKGTIIITHGIAEHSGRYDEITKKIER